MTEHTPTPWRVEDGTDLIWGACNADDLSTYGMGYPVVEGKSASWKPYKPNIDEREANAALIVNAVNNHEAMIEALRAFVVHATYPVSTEINQRGYAWRGEEALDYAKSLADAVLAAVGTGKQP